MKDFIKEYVHIFAILVIGLMFGLGFYYILLNSYHSSSISDKAYVLENDVYYTDFKENLTQIKKNVDSYNYYAVNFKYDLSEMQKIYSNIKYCYSVMSADESIIALKNGNSVSYANVYDYNTYFINNMLDKCYTSNLSWITSDSMANSKVKDIVKNHKLTIDILANNSLYLKNELRNNSSYYYSTSVSNTMIRNNLNSSYRLVLSNYDYFSEIILELSNYLVRGE